MLCFSRSPGLGASWYVETPAIGRERDRALCLDFLRLAIVSPSQKASSASSLSLCSQPARTFEGVVASIRSHWTPSTPVAFKTYVAARSRTAGSWGPTNFSSVSSAAGTRDRSRAIWVSRTSFVRTFKDATKSASRSQARTVSASTPVAFWTSSRDPPAASMSTTDAFSASKWP